MEKIIKIGKQEVKLSNNVAWTMEYRDQFGKDILPSIMPMLGSMLEAVATIASENPETKIQEILASLEGRAMDILLPMLSVEFVDVAVNITWAMAKAADEEIDPPKKWVRQFEIFPLDVVVPTVFELIFKGFVSSKNLKRLKMIKEKMKSLQPSLSMTLSSQESSEG